ncbi:MAG TPA: DUF4349 domain-containing protein [Clostridiales bacterium]|nr:DUF4349 domain-containing protein [Clostridiales bacterium]
MLKKEVKSNCIKRTGNIIKTVNKMSRTNKVSRNCRINSCLIIVFTMVLLFHTLTGCSSSSSKKSDSTAAGPTSATTGFSGKSSDTKDNESRNYQSQVTKSYDDGAKETKENIKKVIKNGEIAVEVKDVEDAYPKIIEIVEDVGGEEFDKYFSVSEEYKRMELVLKIPPEKLDLFEQKLKECVGDGKIKRSNIRSQDITSEYYDYTARFESYQGSRDQLRELQRKAETVEDTLRILSELTRLQADIDSMQGQIKMWDKLINMATITLYIDEEANPMKKTTTVGWRFNSPSEIWMTMKNGFISVINWLYSLLIWILITIVSISPILLVAGVVIYIIYHMKRKKKGRQM